MRIFAGCVGCSRPFTVLFLLWLCAFNCGAGLPATISLIKPSVVLVGTFSATDSPRFSFSGTGFVVLDGNHAVTNAHVVAGHLTQGSGRFVAVQVWSASGAWEMRQAKIHLVDEAHDLAVVKFQGPPVKSLQLAMSNYPEGAEIAFMGFPVGGILGFSHVTHQGYISSVAAMNLPAPTSNQLNARAIRGLRTGSFNVYQLDATAYPGNSGGPIFDIESGQVIGVMNSVLVKGGRESALTNPTGISYGIPSAHVVDMLSKVVAEP